MTKLSYNNSVQSVDIETVTEDLLNKVNSIKNVIDTDNTQIVNNESIITRNVSELDDLNNRLEKEINKDISLYELFKTLIAVFFIFLFTRIFNK